MDKFVKLSAIEKMAKPMDVASSRMVEKDVVDQTDHEGCKCPCCGEPCAECNDGMHEGEDYTTED